MKLLNKCKCFNVKCKLAQNIYVHSALFASFIFNFVLIPQTQLVSSVENMGEAGSLWERSGKFNSGNSTILYQVPLFSTYRFLGTDLGRCPRQQFVYVRTHSHTVPIKLLTGQSS